MGVEKPDPRVLQHTMLTVDGPVYVWGNNTHGQLRDGTTTLRKTPVPALLPDGVVAIEAASNVAYAIRSDGSVLAWGHNLEGKIGDGTEVDRFEPVVVAGLADIVGIAALGDWACALRRDGTVWAWGSNTLGQLGNGTTDPGGGPAQVCGLSEVASVAAGLETGFALRRDGTVWAWGYHAHGECGGYQRGDVSLAPVEVTSHAGEGDVVASDGLAFRSLGRIVAISAGAFTGFAVTANGEVWSWGANGFGQLGNGSTRSGIEDAMAAMTRHDSPQKIVGLTEVVSVVSKCNTAYALRTDGTVWSWGDNRHGALGAGSTMPFSILPQRISDLADVVAISANGDSAYALGSDGTVWAWGENEYGELGDGTFLDRARPVKVSGLEGITSITAGITSAYATAGRRTTAPAVSVPMNVPRLIGLQDYRKQPRRFAMGFWRSGRDQDESKLAAQPKSEPDEKAGPNAGQIEVIAGISVASTMLQALILSEYIDHVRSDLEKPENRTGRYSNSAEQRRLLDCAATYAWAETTDAADINWVLELEGMDLSAYKLALHDLLPTILAYTDRQRIAIESVQVNQIAEQTTGLRGAVYTAQFDLSAKAFKTLEQRERQW